MQGNHTIADTTAGNREVETDLVVVVLVVDLATDRRKHSGGGCHVEANREVESDSQVVVVVVTNYILYTGRSLR